VKSISYASFTPEEVNSLKTVGNEVARKRWLHKWTKEQTPFPEEGNEKAIHKFIDKVFDRKVFLIREEEEERLPAAKSEASLAHPPITSTSFGLPKPTVAAVSQSTWATFDSPAPKTSGGAASSSSSWVDFDTFTQKSGNNNNNHTDKSAAQPPIAAVADPFAVPSTASVPASANANANRTEGTPGGVSGSNTSSAWVAFDSPTKVQQNTQHQVERPKGDSSGSPLVVEKATPTNAPMPGEKGKEEAAAEPARKELPLDLFMMSEPEPQASSVAPPHMGMQQGIGGAFPNGAQPPQAPPQQQMQNWNYGNAMPMAQQNQQQYANMQQGMGTQAFYQPQVMAQAQATWQTQANPASGAPLAQPQQAYAQQPPQQFALPPQASSHWMPQNQYGVNQQTPSPSSNLNGAFSSLHVSPNTNMASSYMQQQQQQNQAAAKAQQQVQPSMGLNNNNSTSGNPFA
jgi:hypothetical protein